MLTDDEAARRACAGLRIEAVGTVGLILEAARASRVAVELAIGALSSLPTQGKLHISAEVLARAIAAVRGE